MKIHKPLSQLNNDGTYGYPLRFCWQYYNGPGSSYGTVYEGCDFFV